jgi:peptidoglycan/xylan/chitin deacetylase (PgdA/CDA1 family)
VRWLLLASGAALGCAPPPSVPAPSVVETRAITWSTPAPVLAPAEPADAEPVPLEAPTSAARAVVLMYHSFGPWRDLRWVRPGQLDEQLRWMAEAGVALVPLGRLVSIVVGGEPPPAARALAAITIDDGERNGYTEAFPILARHRAPFTLGLVTFQLDYPRGDFMLSWAMIREMLASRLCDVASHSHTHRDLTRLSEREALHELVHSRAVIAARAGVTPDLFFYPLGASDGRVQRVARAAGYRAAFGGWGHAIGPDAERMRLPRFPVTHRTTLAELADVLGVAPRPSPEPADPSYDAAL